MAYYDVSLKRRWSICCVLCQVRNKGDRAPSLFVVIVQILEDEVAKFKSCNCMFHVCCALCHFKMSNNACPKCTKPCKGDVVVSMKNKKLKKWYLFFFYFLYSFYTANKCPRLYWLTKFQKIVQLTSCTESPWLCQLKVSSLTHLKYCLPWTCFHFLISSTLLAINFWSSEILASLAGKQQRGRNLNFFVWSKGRKNSVLEIKGWSIYHWWVKCSVTTSWEGIAVSTWWMQCQ